MVSFLATLPASIVIFVCMLTSTCPFSFFFNDTATTEIYTLSLHDALPISLPLPRRALRHDRRPRCKLRRRARAADRKSTRLNSSHRTISYAVFCLKKKTQTPNYLQLLL